MRDGVAERPLIHQRQLTEQKITRINRASENNLNNLLTSLGISGGVDEEEQESTERNFGVSYNLPWPNLIKLMESERFKTGRELPEGLTNIVGTDQTQYILERQEAERRLGIEAEGTVDDPYPVYGTAISTDREYGEGGSVGYGECSVVLRNEDIRDRTSFTFGDSMMVKTAMPLSWNHGIVAKSIFEGRKYKDPGVRYVEAQILGGVAVENIRVINIPFKLVVDGYYSGFRKEFWQKIRQWREANQGIDIRVLISEDD